MNELAWIQKAKDGDRKAFCDLYDLYKDRLYRYAFYRLRSETDAEDAVSECVLSAWKQIGNLREPQAFPAWIFRILAASCSKLIKTQMDQKNTIPLDEYRNGESRSTTGNIGAGGYANEQDNADGQRDIAAGVETRLLLQEALGSLSEEERNMVLLSVVGGLKSNEIAEITGLAAGSVRSSLSRSLKKMRGYFE
ncbi:MAG: RNA polymerase sigma factor [Firmicutes bacterium]|nr:RNA polymerase sigma factor [Bacillota bacterium]